jgi:glutathione S-transferase
VPTLEIVSHPLCPFAQRLVLIAHTKGWIRDAHFKVTYLDLKTLRDTVGAYSPTGEVPALRIDHVCRTTTAEHAAEFLDGLSGPALLPSDAAQRLMVRERERKVRVTLDALRQVFAAQSDRALDSAVSTFFGHLTDIDHDLASDGTDDTTMRMDMVALAPAFSLATFHTGFREHRMWDGVPRLRDIARRLAAHPMVAGSRCPNYAAEFATFFEITQSVFPARGLAGRPERTP